MHIIICYKTDAHHSFSSRDVIGVSQSIEGAIELCKKQAIKEGDKITSEQEFNLRNSKQTQGYSGEGEFYLEKTETEILL